MEGKNTTAIKENKSRHRSHSAHQSPLYLGLDLSTQQLKAVIVNHQLDIQHEASVNFDTDLPQFSTRGGVHRHANGHRVTAPCVMWISALDRLFDTLITQSVDFTAIKGVSASAQQHGSVYWKNGAHRTLGSLDARESLRKQLEDAFSVTDCPVWMDSSTSVECAALEAAIGGPDALAAVTGSRAYERFTGSQIMKIVKDERSVYDETERISLVSSFVGSLLLGKYAPIDVSDGSGMNLLDIYKHEWNDTLIDAIDGDLRQKLGNVVASGTPLGHVSDYFVSKYGFDAQCVVAAGTGDNPASLVGMGLREGDIAVSLGTSDTVFLWINHPKPNATHGHILCNPLDVKAYLALLCYKNGSQTRERIRDKYAQSSWSTFSTALKKTPAGNDGNIAFYFDLREIYPLVMGDFRFNSHDNLMDKFFDNESEIRACIEGQFLRLKAHAIDVGCVIKSTTRILATGGASCNKDILQVLADVFNANVYIQEIPNSAALGAAYLARLSVSDDRCAINGKCDQYELAATPIENANEIYAPLEARYRKLQQLIQREESLYTNDHPANRSTL